MKKFVLVLALIFAFTGVASAERVVSGTYNETLSFTEDILLQIPTQYSLTVTTYKVLGSDATSDYVDLNGVWDFGTLGTEPLGTNPYGTSGADRIGSSHYAEIRISVTNNFSGYIVVMQAVGEVFNLPATPGSTAGSIMHFACYDFGDFESYPTNDLTNLNYQEGGAGSESDGLYIVPNDVGLLLYDTGAGTILSDQFVALVFLNNVYKQYTSPDTNGDGIVGQVTYSMIPY